MTREQIQALTDAELVAAAAEKVMPPFVSMAYWRPLESWDDVMQVVAVMRTKGWRIVFRDAVNETFEVMFWNAGPDATVCVDAGNEKRAILEAALMAMEGSQ